MKYWMVVGLLAVVMLAIMCKGNQDSDPQDLKEVRQTVLAINKQFDKRINDQILRVEQDLDEKVLQSGFDSLRSTYKSMEWAVAYFMPTTARFLNGPNLDEIELEENTVIEAEGLQTLEEYFYPNYNSAEKQQTLIFLKKLKSKSLAIDTYFEVNSLSLPQLIEALRNQVFRITTLGITGFDTPVSGRGLVESIDALNGIAAVLDQIQGQVNHPKEIDTVQNLIKIANEKLGEGTPKDQFDYLNFMDQHLNKIADALFKFRKLENIPYLNVSHPISPEASNLFSKNAFNPDFFVPSDRHMMNTGKVTLGAKLFRDNILSGNGSRSCVSCHHPEKAFTDGLKVPTTMSGAKMDRNTPALSYSNYQHGQFWDMRSEDLEGQSMDVITNKDEMHGNMDQIARRLNQHKTYIGEFQKIFKSDTIAVWQLQNVLASYVRSLAKFSSRFDRYMRGESQLLTSQEKEGFNLFVGKAKCATCHFVPLFNGTVPPEYAKTESEVLGIATDYRNHMLDPDRGRGRYHATVSQLQYAFKTPTIRNITKTAPYMHNGGYTTLEQVMDFYNKGGGQQFGFKLDNQTLPTDSLGLTEKETAKIIAFLKALDD
ncbi:cytochrome C peroxidase [Sphingobacterium sp. CZ-UAM]|uniref:cytochrome-c peroxidase n=1 Tax=unclassified Sphingobacterium TaxID=2609468 RepID=UPI000985517A|nr:cytochrome c peroxidase [Sphingobacterium sp. CZ-UAM]OOG15919.1 cytochrome C peroxidase [Sphingobacterium sp. CZ-UAM]